MLLFCLLIAFVLSAYSMCYACFLHVFCLHTAHVQYFMYSYCTWSICLLHSSLTLCHVLMLVLSDNCTCSVCLLHILCLLTSCVLFCILCVFCLLVTSIMTACCTCPLPAVCVSCSYTMCSVCLLYVLSTFCILFYLCSICILHVSLLAARMLSIPAVFAPSVYCMCSV
jgi:hypothetical protein